ncbi:hypothetical protein AAHB33_09220 [Paenarthrobacter sp. S56]|uniref:hypothetical protein n=1 Tax=Paenarthrobacter sp. S56 TaxID=3138179 RepID=UPI00321B63CA
MGVPCPRPVLVIQSGLALAARHHALPSPAGIIWTAITAIVMFALAAGKASTGKALGISFQSRCASSLAAAGDRP